MARHSEAQITFRLSRRLARRIDQLARRSGRKRSEVLRDAAAAYVEFADATEPPAGRVRDLIGSVESGIPDLAERHSAYLKKLLAHGS